MQSIKNWLARLPRNKIRRNHPSAFFSLLELLVVVSIVLILSAILIPKLLSARSAASQANAAASMRSINTALTMAYTSFGAFPAALSNLGGAAPCVASLTTTCSLDPVVATALGTGTYNSYVWTYALTTTPVGFTLTAAPAPTNSAVRNFYLDQNGTIHISDSGAASATSPTLGN